MNKNNILPCVEINPPCPPTSTIIWLHGLGADGHDFVPIIPSLNLPKSLNLRFVFPNAPVRPVTINNGYPMPAWYDITSITNERTLDKAGLSQSVQDIIQLIAIEINKGIKSDCIFIAGFSQGAAIALSTLLTFHQPLAGIIALSGYLPMMNEIMSQATPVSRSIPIFMAHGTNDMIVPYELGNLSHTTLQQAGFKIEWHRYPMGHEVCLDEIHDIGKFISAQTLANQ